MGSPAATSGGGVLPSFSSSQQAQSLLAPSILGRRVPCGSSSQMAARRKISSEVLATSFAVGMGLEKNPINLEDPGDNENMRTKRKKSFEDGVTTCAVGVGQQNHLFKLEDIGDNEKAILMSAHLQMLGKFFELCSKKKGKSRVDDVNTTKVNFDGEKDTFKDKVTAYFGEYLPPSVIDELCLLVEENSYGKCHFCSLPAESLVLSVLQILLHAADNIGNKAQTPQVASAKRAKGTAETIPRTSVQKPRNNPVTKDSIHKKGPQALGNKTQRHMHGFGEIS